MTPEALLRELTQRIDMAGGSAALVLAIADSDGEVDDDRLALVSLLSSPTSKVVDLGAVDGRTGPRRWAERTAEQPAGAYVLSYTPASKLAAPPWSVLLNTERDLLRDLAGPTVLVIARETEKVVRKHAPDFFTWVAKAYELPRAADLLALAQKAGPAPAVVEAPAPPEDPIRFLHVSDLHLRPAAGRRYDQDKVLRGLVDFLARDRASFPLDLVFVTGDLAHAGKAEEYALVAELLGKLIEVTGVPAEKFFVVPGNHDVDRDVGRWLLRTPAKGEDADVFFTEAKHRVFHAQKHAAYAKAMGAVLGEKRPLGLGVGEDAVELVEVRDAKIAVASFNSAWFAQDDDDRGKLWLGEACVDKAGQRVADLEVPFAIALMHHPTDQLHEDEASNVESYLSRSFDLVLRGHLHREKTRSIATQRGGYVEVAGPAAYQGSQWPNGCFLGEIRPNARSVKLRPYAYAAGPDPWVLDAKVFPDDESEGYCRTFVVPEKKRLPSAVVRQREKASDERVRTAPLAELRQIAESLGVAEARAELPKDVLEKTVKAARAHVDSQGLWAQADSAAEQNRFGAMMVGLTRRAPVSRQHPDFLKAGLLELRKRIHELRSAAPGQFELTPQRVKIAVRALFQGVFDGPPRPSVHASWGVDVWGGPVGQQAVAVYGDCIAHPELQQDASAGWQILDECLDGNHAAHGALILVGLPGPTDTEPHLSQVKTPAGRDVWLLRL